MSSVRTAAELARAKNLGRLIRRYPHPQNGTYAFSAGVFGRPRGSRAQRGGSYARHAGTRRGRRRGPVRPDRVGQGRNHPTKPSITGRVTRHPWSVITGASISNARGIVWISTTEKDKKGRDAGFGSPLSVVPDLSVLLRLIEAYRPPNSAVVPARLRPPGRGSPSWNGAMAPTALRCIRRAVIFAEALRG